MDIEESIKEKVKEIVKKLVNGEYKLLEQSGKLDNITSDELEDAIIQYGESLSLPPEESYNKIDIFKLTNPKKYREEYFVDMDLWTDGHKSDLTLSCEVTVNDNNEVNVTVSSVHVL